MIKIILLIGFGLDILLTYNFLELYKARFPEKDFTAVEANPLIRSMVRNYGLFDGMMISSSVILALLIVLMSLLKTNWLYFLAGCYYMMVVFHLTNFLALKRLGNLNNKKEVKNGKTKKRRNT